MPSTRRPGETLKTDQDMVTNYENMDLLLGENNSNSIEINLENIINTPTSQEDSGAKPNCRATLLS